MRDVVVATGKLEMILLICVFVCIIAGKYYLLQVLFSYLFSFAILLIALSLCSRFLLTFVWEKTQMDVTQKPRSLTHFSGL